MLDRRGSQLRGVRDVGGVARVNGNRKGFRLRFAHYRRQKIHLEPLEGVTWHTALKDGFDGVDSLKGERVHLLARFLWRFGSADKAGQKRGAHRFRYELCELRPMSAFGREKRPVKEQLAAEFFAAAVETPQLQH